MTVQPSAINYFKAKLIEMRKAPRQDFFDAQTELLRIFAEVQKVMEMPLPVGSFNEIYIGAGAGMRAEFEKLERAYRRLEEIKKLEQMLNYLGDQDK